MTRILRAFALLVIVGCGIPAVITTALCEWQQVALDGYQVNSVGFRPGDRDTAFAAIYYNDRGVYRSTDAGQTWTLIGSLPWADDIAIDPIAKETIYATCSGAIWRSMNGGVSWQRKDDEFDFIIFDYGPVDIAVNPSSPETLYVTTAAFTGGGGLYCSGDHAEHWQAVGTPWVNQKGSIAINPLDPATMYLAVRWNGPLGRTLDGCVSWQGVLATVVDDIAVNPEDPDIVFAAADALHRSQDGGVSWTSLGSSDGLTDLITAVAINPANPAIILAAGGTHVFRSTDGGTTWVDFSDGLPEGAYISSVATDGELGEVNLLGTYGQGIYRRNCSTAGIDHVGPTVGKDHHRLACGPNPFTGEARISYTIEKADHITLNVYSVSGRLVNTIVDRVMEAGQGTATWPGTDSSARPVAAGLYFVEMRTSRDSQVEPIVLLR